MSNLSNMLMSMLVALTIGCIEDSEMPLLEPTPSIKELLCKRWRLLQTVSGSDTSPHFDTINYPIDSTPSAWISYNKDGTFFGYTNVPEGHTSYPSLISIGHWFFNQDSTVLITQTIEVNGEPYDSNLIVERHIVELTPSALRTSFINPRAASFATWVPFEAADSETD